MRSLGSRFALTAALLASLSAGGAANAVGAERSCALERGTLVHGPRDGHNVAITFDMCPTRRVPGFAADIVEYLARESVPTTFFISGKWAERHAAQLAQIEAVPFFEIALHGNRHRHLQGASLTFIEAEIRDGQSALRRLGAVVQPIFRPPYGDRPPGLEPAAQRAGVTSVLWDVAPGDPDPHESAADIERRVLQRTRSGSIIVLHANGGGISTAAALPAVVDGLRQRGFHFVTVGELIHECAQHRDAP